jgi:hypothetical protein
MVTTVTNRKLLNLKRWEFATPAPVASTAATAIISSRHYRQQQLMVQAATVAYLYSPLEDGWMQLPSPALAGTWSAGGAGVASAVSTGTATTGSTLTATGGTTTTIITNQTLARDVRGYSVHIVSGPNAGVTLPIVSNTTGANGVLTVAVQAAAFTASTVYRLLTPVWYVVGAGTLAAGSFRKYDFATNTWTTLSQTNLPATIATDGRLMSTPSWMDLNYLTFATGTASSASATTLVNSAKTWTVNQWTNYQVRIVSGTGAGQVRSIASNTATALTVATWTITPDATSVYTIEGNDDFLYYIGNNAVTMYRFQISTNTWSTLTPTLARAGAPSTGMSGHWVWGSTDTDWTNESSIKNGRYLYSFRAGAAAGNPLDYYDIAANTWVNAVTHSPATETLTTGTKYIYNGNFLYIQKDATGRWFRYNFVTSEMDGLNTMLYTQGAAVIGDTAFDATYFDGATSIVYLYMLLNTSTVMLRQMVI